MLHSIKEAELNRIEYERLTNLYVEARTNLIDVMNSKQNEHRIEEANTRCAQAFARCDKAYRIYLGEKEMVLS